MNRRLSVILILLGLAALVSCSTPQRSGLSKDDILVLSTFGKHPGAHPNMAADVAKICLRNDLSRDQAAELLGNTGLRPTRHRMFYGIAPSQYMSLQFDDNGNITGAFINNEPIVLEDKADSGRKRKP
jgi:flagellar hook protein FlgE